MGVKNAYQQYHDLGFEVIGVSVDPNPAVLTQFLEQAQLPWMTVTNNKLAEQCGADMLPFGVLLDTTGKVTDIFAQGRLLQPSWKPLFGPAAKVESPAAKALSPLGKQSQYMPTRTIRQRSLGLVAAGLPTASLVEAVASRGRNASNGGRARSAG